jgi:hypothetical protein
LAVREACPAHLGGRARHGSPEYGARLAVCSHQAKFSSVRGRTDFSEPQPLPPARWVTGIFGDLLSCKTHPWPLSMTV